MSDALSYSVELAAERSSERYYLEKRLQKHGLSYDSLENRLKKLGLKRYPSDYLLYSLESLKNNAYNMLDALVESGYKYYDREEYFIVNDNSLSSVLNLLDAEQDTPNRYANVFRKLKEKMGYKTVNVSEQIFQVDRVFKISRFKGDVCKAIDVLAEVGFSLRTFSGKKIILYEELDVIRDLAQTDTDKFLKTFYKLKEKLGYKTINVQFPKSFNKNSMGQIEKIIELSGIGNVCEAIDAFSEWRNLDVNAYGKDNSLHAGGLYIDGKKVDRLPPWGITDISRDFKKYKIDKKKGITNKDVEILRYISDRLWKDCLEGLKYLEILSPCFYLQGNSKNFIECFQHLNTDDKKRIIRSIFKCEKASNEEVTRWLDENEPELVREVGLGLV